MPNASNQKIMDMSQMTRDAVEKPQALFNQFVSGKIPRDSLCHFSRMNVAAIFHAKLSEAQQVEYDRHVFTQCKNK